jgi:hypothetical protein
VHVDDVEGQGEKEMKLELRPRLQADHVTRVMCAVLICESEAESKIIDKVFGNKVLDADGLIARRTVEVRLADGFREHYLHIAPEAPWIPVGERLPTHVHSVLMLVTNDGLASFDGHPYVEIGIYNAKRGRWQMNFGDDDVDVEVSTGCQSRACGYEARHLHRLRLRRGALLSGEVLQRPGRARNRVLVAALRCGKRQRRLQFLRGPRQRLGQRPAQADPAVDRRALLPPGPLPVRGQGLGARLDGGASVPPAPPIAARAHPRRRARAAETFVEQLQTGALA